MTKVTIQKVPTVDLESWTHCWVPIVNGRALEWKSPDGEKTEPFRSVRGAKRAAAKELGVAVQEIDFDIQRGE